MDGVVGEWNPHAAVPIRVRYRAPGLAKVFPDLVRVDVVVRVGVVEVGGEVGNRAIVIGVVRHPLPDVGADGAVAERRHHVFDRT